MNFASVSVNLLQGAKKVPLSSGFSVTFPAVFLPGLPILHDTGKGSSTQSARREQNHAKAQNRSHVT